MYPNIVSLSFICFLFIKIYMQIYLFLKNRQHIIDHKDSVPSDFADIVTIEDHKSS